MVRFRGTAQWGRLTAWRLSPSQIGVASGGSQGFRLTSGPNFLGQQFGAGSGRVSFVSGMTCALGMVQEELMIILLCSLATHTISHWHLVR